MAISKASNSLQPALLPPESGNKPSSVKAVVRKTIFVLPDDVIKFTIGNRLSLTDQRNLACVCKLFATLFQVKDIPKDRAKCVLEEVTGCSRLTSMQTLERQIRDLKKYYPEKQWTMAEVLKLYSLKTVDFSEKGIEAHELQALLFAFMHIMESSEPKETIKIERQAGEFITSTVIYSLDKDQLLRLAEKAGISIESVEKDNIDKFRLFMSYAFCDMPKIRAAEIFADSLGDIYNNVIFIRKPCEQPIFGYIETFNVACNNITLAFNQTLRSFFQGFCPRLKSLCMNFTPQDSLLVETFFLAENRRDHLTHLKTGLHYLGDISWSQYELLSCQKNLEDVFSGRSIVVLRDIARAGSGCRKLRQVSLDFGQLNLHRVTKKEFQDVLLKFAENCPDIEELCLNELPKDEEMVLFVAKLFKNLNKLTIVFDPNLSEKLVISFLSNCPSLKTLIFHGEQFDLWDVHLERLLFQLCNRHSQLEFLTLGFAQDMFTSRILLNFVSNLPHLKVFTPSLPEPESYARFSPVLDVRQCYQKVKEQKCSGKELITELKKLGPENYSLFLTGLYYNGLASLENAEKIIEEDVGILEKCRRKVFSLKGNIIEQFFTRAFAMLDSKLLCGEMATTESGILKFKLDKWSNCADKEMYLIFEGLMKDKGCTHDQLFFYYKTVLTDAHKQQLIYHLWRLNGEPQHYDGLTEMINTDIRCLLEPLHHVIKSYH